MYNNIQSTQINYPMIFLEGFFSFLPIEQKYI